MSELRKSTLNQLKRIDKEIKKQGGTTDRRSDSEKGLPNSMCINNPLDGKRKISTYEDYAKIDIPDADLNVKMKNEKKIIKINGYDYFYNDGKLYADEKCLNEIDIYKQLTKNEREQFQNNLKYRKNEMKNILCFDKMFEDNDSSFFLLNEGKIKEEIQNMIEKYYMEDNIDCIDTLTKLTGLNYDQVSTILDYSTEENAMENLMTYENNSYKNFQKISYKLQNLNCNININDEKQNNNDMKNILSFDKMFENGPDDTPQEIMKNMKTIANWHVDENSPKKEFNINLIGKQIDTGKIKGFIQRIEGNDVYIDSIVEPLGVIKMSLKDAIKGYKPTKEELVKGDFAIEGPNNKSLGSVPKEGGGYSTKLDAKATVAADQKISNKINTEKIIKKLSDMSNSFDSTLSKPHKHKHLSPAVDSKSEVAKDTKTISNTVYTDKKIKKFSDDLSIPFDIKVIKTHKHTNLNPGIDQKAKVELDKKIKNKNNKVKSFSELNSDLTGPKSKK